MRKKMITRSGNLYGSDAVVELLSSSESSNLRGMAAAQPKINPSAVPSSNVPETPNTCRALVPYVAPEEPSAKNPEESLVAESGKEGSTRRNTLVKCAVVGLLAIVCGVVIYCSVPAMKNLLAKFKASKSAPKIPQQVPHTPPTPGHQARRGNRRNRDPRFMA
jgi:hypothetical protein